jgi:hypothetical protein
MDQDQVPNPGIGRWFFFFATWQAACDRGVWEMSGTGIATVKEDA